MFRESSDGQIYYSKNRGRLKNWKNYGYEYYNKKGRNIFPYSWPTNTHSKKLLHNNLPDKTNMFIKQCEPPIRALDYIVNLNMPEKKTKYINAYFTETDLSRRKLYHESKTTHPNFKPEILEDTSYNSNYSNSYDLSSPTSLMESSDKSIRIKKMERDLEEFFTSTSCGFKEYYREDDLIEYYCRRKRCHKKISQEYGYRPVNNTKESTVLYVPEMKYSKINVLFNAHDRFNNEREVNNSNNNFNYSNMIDLNGNYVQNSISSTCLQKKIMAEKDKRLKTEADQIETVSKSRTFTKLGDYLQNDKNIINEKTITFAEDKTLEDRVGVNMELSFYGNNSRNNMGKVQSMQKGNNTYNYITVKNPETLTNDKLRFISTQTSDFTDSQSNGSNSNYIHNSSDSSLLDYSVSKRQQFVGNSIFKNSSKISNSTEINYNIINSSNKNWSSKSQVECCLNDLYNSKKENLNNNEALLYLKSEGFRCKRHDNPCLHDFDNFHSKFRNYLLDQNLKEYYLRRKISRTLSHQEKESSFIKGTNCYNNCKKIEKPISFEKDVLLKNLSNMNNFRSPLCLMKEDCLMENKSRKFFNPTEKNLTDSSINRFNFDEKCLNTIKNDNFPLNITIPDTPVVERNEEKEIKGSNIKTPPLVCNQGESIQDNQFVNIYSAENRQLQFEIMNENTIFNGEFGHTLQKNIDFVQGLYDDNLRKNLRKNNKSIEVIFPVKSKRIICSCKALTDETGSSDATLDLVMFNETDKNMKVNDEFSFQVNKTVSIVDRSEEVGILKDKKIEKLHVAQVNNPAEKMEIFQANKEKTSSQNDKFLSTNYKNIDLNSEMNDRDFLNSFSSKILKSNHFKEEIERIVENYLKSNAVINCMNNDNFNVMLIPKNHALMDVSQTIINSLKIKQSQTTEEKLKNVICSFCYYKNKKLIPKNDVSVNVNPNGSRNVNSDFTMAQGPLKSKELSKLKLQKNDLISLSKMRSFPIFNVSSLKIKTKSVISCHCKNQTRQIYKSKAKRISKTSNKSDLSFSGGNVDRNKFLNSDSDDSTKFQVDGTEIYRKLNLFNDFLLEIKRKQDTILSILSQDPCGLLFKFPKNPSVMLVKKSKHSSHKSKLKSKVNS